MLTLRVLPLMPRVLVPLVMQWWIVSLVMLALMVRVLQWMLRLTLSLVMTTVRVLQVMVLGVGPRMGGCRRFWVWALATPGGGPGERWLSVGSPYWRCWSPLMSGQVLANPGGGC